MKTFLIFLLLLALVMVPITHSQSVVVVHQYKVVSAGPALPAFTSPVAVYGVNNFNPVGYPAGQGTRVEGSVDFANSSFLEDAPYVLDLDGIGTAGNPPYLLSDWSDQNSNASELLQTSSARPTFNYATHALDFDGTATGLATAANVTLGVQTLTLYLRFKAGSLSETSVLFETGSGAIENVGIVRVSMVVGVLTVSVSDQTAVKSLLNTKIKTISDSDWHLLSVVIDTTNGTAANQVQVWVDGSTTGVTSPISTTLASENLTTSEFNVGAGNNAASAFFTGSMSHLLTFSVAQNGTLRGQWQDYINSLAFTPSSVLVAGAGTADVNGTWLFTASDGSGIPYYNLTGHGASTSTWVIKRAGIEWRLFTSDSVAWLYNDEGNLWVFPWQGTWGTNDGDSPAPTVTEQP